MGKKLLLVVATFAAVVVAGLGASAASAGEATGNCSPNTKSEKAAANCKEDQNQNSNSVCSFSGQNDDPTGAGPPPGANGPGGRTQSYGQNVAAGRNDPSHGGFNPGDACQGGSN